MSRQNSTKPQVKWYVRLSRFAQRRVRELAIGLIIVSAGIAVFAGSRSSAMAFGFSGLAAISFALMPDALMVYSAAKMRERGLNPNSAAAHTARKWMRIALGFSVFTNMNAAALEIIDPTWENFPVYVKVMTVVYHGMVVVFLWGATEVATRNRSTDRVTPAPKPKSDKASTATGTVAQARQSSPKAKAAKASDAPKVLTPTTIIPMTSTDAPKVNGQTPSGLILARR